MDLFSYIVMVLARSVQILCHSKWSLCRAYFGIKPSLLFLHMPVHNFIIVKGFVPLAISSKPCDKVISFGERV
jgi:hypothetical protein